MCQSSDMVPVVWMENGPGAEFLASPSSAQRSMPTLFRAAVLGCGILASAGLELPVEWIFTPSPSTLMFWKK